MPVIKIRHLHTPTPHTQYGMKGMGEGGAVAPPAAITNAVRDALLAIGRSQRNPDHTASVTGGNSTGGRWNDEEVTFTARTPPALHCGQLMSPILPSAND
jgi:hypothetical protein